MGSGGIEDMEEYMGRGFAEVANFLFNTRKTKCVYGPMVRVLGERRTDGHKVERK